MAHRFYQLILTILFTRYDYLVVATGLKVNFSAISGLETALRKSESGVSSIYSYDTLDNVWRDIHRFREGKAVSSTFSLTPSALTPVLRFSLSQLVQSSAQARRKRSCGWSVPQI
jgi:hypothetical protein